jgi:lysophospholipase L1-like esterase
MKLLCLGDSLTEGYGIEAGHTWVNLVKRDLKIEVINAGISGDTTSGMLARCERLLLEHQPTYIIILGGTNDLWFGLKDEFIISNIQAISRHAKYYGTEALIGLPTLSYNLNELNFIHENYSECIRHFRTTLIHYCELEDKPYIDFAINMASQHFLDDGLHPNEDGQIIMKENAINILKLNV